MPRYTARITLCEEGKPEVLATKTARLYSEELENLDVSEYALLIKSIEIIRDMQWHASRGNVAQFYKPER